MAPVFDSIISPARAAYAGCVEKGNTAIMLALIAELTGVGGYLDIGINDTMKDRLVNFLDAVIFSIVLLRQAARTGQIRRKDHTEGIDAG
ncbi:MAG: hypothetical protein II879_00950 [Clostridia bacterium]|nr:hypothetical protein [Clostridia bacterium]